MYRLRINGKTVQKSAHYLSYWVNIGHFDKSDGLQIDHIDGNKLNNHYTNLRRVTPRDNCNNINTAGELTPQSRSNYRITNGDLTSGRLCLACFNNKRAENIPTRDELIKDLMSHKPLVKLASKYGISDNAYRKWLTKRGLPIKYKEIKSFILSV